MNLEEFTKIAQGFIRAGTVITPGIGPTIPAVAALHALRDQLPPEIKDRVMIGIALTGHWYVTFHPSLVQNSSAPAPESDLGGTCICTHREKEHDSSGKCTGVIISKDGVGVCPCGKYDSKA